MFDPYHLNFLFSPFQKVTLISPEKYSSLSSDCPIIHHISSFDIKEYQEIISEEYNLKIFGNLKNYLNSKYLDDFNLYKKVANETIKVDLFICDLFLNDACIDIAWLMKKPLVTISSKLCKYSIYLLFLKKKEENNNNYYYLL